jgi:hypothetical protein
MNEHSFLVEKQKSVKQKLFTGCLPDTPDLLCPP